MALDVTKPLKVQDLGATTTKIAAKIAPAFKAGKTQNGTVSFFTDSDTTGAAAFSFELPAYTNSDTSVTFENYKIKVNLDASSDNILTLTANGLMVDRSAVQFDFAVFDSDSYLNGSTFRIATDEEVEAYLNSVLPV